MQCTEYAWLVNLVLQLQCKRDEFNLYPRFFNSQNSEVKIWTSLKKKTTCECWNLIKDNSNIFGKMFISRDILTAWFKLWIFWISRTKSFSYPSLWYYNYRMVCKEKNILSHVQCMTQTLNDCSGSAYH